MIILFLDVDGVLNNRPTFKKLADSGKHTTEALDDECIGRLKKLVDTFGATGVKIVLSSSWRFSPDHVLLLTRKLKEFGLKIEDQTTKKGSHRGTQIAEWLEKNKPRFTEHRKILILDDDSDMLPEQMPFFVKTNMDTGLTDEHVAKAIEIIQAIPTQTPKFKRTIWTEEEFRAVCFCKPCSKQTLHVGTHETEDGHWVHKCVECNTFD